MKRILILAIIWAMNKPSSPADLSRDQVERIAHLANLSLTKEEIKKFQKQLSAVLNYFKVLQKMDTSGVQATSQVTGLENVIREDNVSSGLSVEQALSNSPQKYNHFFQIKGIFEDES